MGALARGPRPAVVVALVIRALLVLAAVVALYHLAVVLAWESLKAWWRAPKGFVQRTTVTQVGCAAEAEHGLVSTFPAPPEPHARGPPHG